MINFFFTVLFLFLVGFVLVEILLYVIGVVFFHIEKKDWEDRNGGFRKDD